MKPALIRFTRHAPVLPVLLAVGLGLLALTAGASIWLVDEARTNAERVAATLRLETQLADLLLELRRAESSQRGFLLSGDQRFLESYHPAVAAAPRALAEIKSLVGGDAAQSERFSRLEPEVTEKLDELGETVRRYESGDAAGTLAYVKTGRGLVLMNAIRTIVEAMRADGRDQLGAQLSDAKRLERFVIGAHLLGMTLIAGIALLAFFYARQSNAAMQAAQDTLNEANASLETQVAERTQHLTEANEEIQSFASTVSHDLRSPLVNIMGFTSEIEACRKDVFERLATSRAKAPDQGGEDADAGLARDFDEAIGFIKGSIQKMDRLINAILTIAREGGRTLRPEPIDMSALAGSIAGSLAHKAQEAGAEIHIQPLPGIASDRLAVEQIFSNLLDNAVKYLRPDAPGRIEVSGHARPYHVVYEVRDNGRGIEPNDRQRVFELFRRSGRQDQPGDGMGLAHVRSLVRRLGGIIRLEPAPGHGSVFKITLPKTFAHSRTRDT